MPRSGAPIRAETVNVTYCVAADVPRYSDGTPTGSLLNSADACRFLGVTRSALTFYERQGQLKSARVGRNCRRLYRIEKLLEFVKLREEIT